MDIIHNYPAHLQTDVDPPFTIVVDVLALVGWNLAIGVSMVPLVVLIILIPLPGCLVLD